MPAARNCIALADKKYKSFGAVVPEDLERVWAILAAQRKELES